jgi:NADP-dependent 3-hydroxy acid dehydrogenase YdfG
MLKMTSLIEVNGPMKGQWAMITGSSAGIGKACAITLAKAGINVYLTGRNEAALKEVQTSCKDFGVEAEYLVGDLSSRAFVKELVDWSQEAAIFINNAGSLVYAPILEVTTDECAQMFSLNVVAAYDVTREMALRMKERGRGHMVFITSLSARNVNMHAVVYAATKHALSAFAKGFRLELKKDMIKVTEIAPGMVDTDIRNSVTHPDVLKAIASRPFSPISAQDVADSVLYAVSASDGCCPDLIELRPRLG